MGVLASYQMIQTFFTHLRLDTHISPYLAEWQHGFVKGKSCETQLVVTHHDWVTALDEGRQVDVAFVDFSARLLTESIILRRQCG